MTDDVLEAKWIASELAEVAILAVMVITSLSTLAAAIARYVL